MVEIIQSYSDDPTRKHIEKVLRAVNDTWKMLDKCSPFL